MIKQNRNIMPFMNVFAHANVIRRKRRGIKYRKKYDLVHIHYNDWIACRLFSLLAQFLNTPVVVTLNAELLCKSRFQKYLCTPSFNLLHRIALEL